MSTRQEEKERRRQERLNRELAEQERRNRVLVGLPERLRKSNAALRDFEQKFEQVAQVYSQRLILKDSVVLDNIADILNLPPIEGDPPSDSPFLVH